MNTAKTRAMIIGGALLLIVAVGAFWMLPKNQADQNVPDAASDLWNQPADTAVTPDPNKTDTAAKTSDETGPDLVAGMTDYVVGPDESLSVIAEKFYGDRTMYWLIEWYNEETLSGNIDKLTAGTHLNIPDKAKANQPKPSTQQQPNTGTEKPSTQPKTGTEKPNTQTPAQNTNPSTTPGR